MIALAWILFLYGCWDERTGPLSTCLFLFSLWAASDRLNLRPEIFSFAIMAVYFVILEKEHAKPTKLLFLLVPLQALWANIEGIWPIGLSIIGAYFAESLVSRYFSKPWIERPEKPAPARFLVLLALCTVACFANPYLAKGFLFPLTLFREVSMAHYFKEAIVELRPPFADGDSTFVRVPFVIIAVLSCLSFILNFRKLRPAHVLLWAALLILALRATRNVGPFSLCACFFAAINSRSLLAHPNSGLRAGLLATEDLEEAGEAVEYLRLATRPQPATRGAAIRVDFGGLPDLEAAVNKLHIEGASLEPKEIFDLFLLLDRAADAKSVLTAAAQRRPRSATGPESQPASSTIISRPRAHPTTDQRNRA